MSNVFESSGSPDEHLSEKPPGELNMPESNILQSKLAILLFNIKRNKEGKEPIEHMDRDTMTKQEEELFTEAFNQWIDERNAWQSKLPFTEFLAKEVPGIKVDINNLASVERLFQKLSKMPIKNVEHLMRQDMLG